MRLATYNVEWFTHLFDDDGTLLDDGAWSRRHDVRRSEQIAALGRVFSSLDADAVMVIEAPDGHRRRSGTTALENFAARFGLRARKALMGFVNDTQQEISLLYDPGVLEVSHDPIGAEPGAPAGAEAPRFDGEYLIDLDVDAVPEPVRWSKPPLEVAAVSRATGAAFRLIGVHAKSKAPHGAGSAKAAMQIAIENRRKQLAQCVWLRERVDWHLAQDIPLIVLGDFNDGPGLDEYEKLFGRSGVEIVMGSEGNGPVLFDPAAAQAAQSKLGAAPTTTRFWLNDQKRWLEALLDFVMVSEDLRALTPTWRIWHPFDDPVCFQDGALQKALLTASDHFPVTLDIDL